MNVAQDHCTRARCATVAREVGESCKGWEPIRPGIYLNPTLYSTSYRTPPSKESVTSFKNKNVAAHRCSAQPRAGRARLLRGTRLLAKRLQNINLRGDTQASCTIARAAKRKSEALGSMHGRSTTEICVVGNRTSPKLIGGLLWRAGWMGQQISEERGASAADHFGLQAFRPPDV